ncbi:MAG: hypothetical protein AB1449_06010 [Chloroflexota bacterium]
MTSRCQGWVRRAPWARTATDLQGSWAGLSRQPQVLKALKDRALTPEILPRIPDLIDQFRDAVVTDLSVQQGMDFACLAEEVEPGAVSFAGVGVELVTEQADGSLLPQTEGVRELLEGTFITHGS